MAFIHKLLNLSLPIITLILIPILMFPYLFFKLLLSVIKVVCKENLARKVVLITGAASGIGEQLAYEYARRGAILSLVDIREDNLGTVADKARSLGSPQVITIGADVTKVQDCKQCVDETVNHFGRLDHLVNDAGILRSEAVEDIVEDVSTVTPMMARLGFIPMGTASECAKAIVESVCRGDMYVTEPSWVKVFHPWKMFFPEALDFASRLVFGCMPNNNINLPSPRLKQH